MKRGQVWTLAGGAPYASKPRPVVILQDDRFSETDSIVVCGFTSTLTEASLLRVRVDPSPENGLQRPSDGMVEKIVGVPRERLGRQIGELEVEVLERIVAAAAFLIGAVHDNSR